MTIAITGKRTGVFGYGHESITHYRWVEDGTGATSITEKATAVQWVESGRSPAYVPGPPVAPVGVNRAASGAAWLQTYADGVWSNNIMALPEV
jgi:hypothetical protein